MQTGESIPTLATPCSPRALGFAPRPISKKDRKVEKKAQKHAAKPKVITTEDIARVDQVLHPKDEATAANDACSNLEAATIKLGLSFHKAISNTKAVRYEHITCAKQNHRQPKVTAEDMDRILSELDVAKGAKSENERRLVAAIRKAVEADIVNCETEHYEIRVREASFWRWASAKAYHRLVENGYLWDKRAEVTASAKKKAATVPEDILQLPDLAALDVDDAEETESRFSSRTGSVSSPSESSHSSADSSLAITDGDIWTPVASVRRKGKGRAKSLSNKPGLLLKLSSNRGPAKLEVRPKTRFGEGAYAEALMEQHADSQGNV